MSNDNDAPRLAWQDAPPTADNVGEVWVVQDGRAWAVGLIFLDYTGFASMNGKRVSKIGRDGAKWARLPLPEGAS